MNEVARHNRQSPTSTQKGAMVNPINSTMEENSQNMFNSTINQLLSQSALVNLHSVIDSECVPLLVFLRFFERLSVFGR